VEYVESSMGTPVRRDTLRSAHFFDPTLGPSSADRGVLFISRSTTPCAREPAPE